MRKKDTDKSSEEGRKKRVHSRRGRKKHGQPVLKAAKKGVYSCVTAACVCIVLALSVLAAYLLRGNAPGLIGGGGAICWLISWYGVITAARGFKERERKYLTCKIGIVCNTLLGVGLTALFVGGLM